MQKLLFLLSVLLLFSSNLYSQYETPTSEQKQILNPIIDEGFVEWAENWRYDKYVSRSTKVKSIKIDEDYGDIVCRGVFSYRRFSVLFQGTFTAKVSMDGELINIKYVDADGLSGSYTF